MDLVSGMTAEGFERVKDAFEVNLAEGLDVGASLCVEHQGRVVVDLWGGHQDESRNLKWQSDSLVNVFSATKGIAAIALAKLIAALRISYDQPVREIWPELNAARDGLSLGDLLAHRAGLCGFTDRLRVSDLYDWQAIINGLNVQTPLWRPGSAAGYHAVTWGYLAGEIVRRVSGTTLGEVIQQEICARLGADFFLGLPDTEDHRVAPLISVNRARLPAQENVERDPVGPWHEYALGNPLIRPYQDAYSLPWRRAEIAASNGHATARGIARIYGALLNDDKLLAPAELSNLLAPRVDGEADLVLGQKIRRGAGIILNSLEMLGPEPCSFGHPGAGGSLGFADPRNQLAVGFVMNQMLTGEYAHRRTHRFISAIYDCLADG